MSEQYTIEDFLDGKIYVQCDNEEERQKLKVLSGWNGEADALNRSDPVALYRHENFGRMYGHTFYSHIGEPYYDLPVIAFDDLQEAMPNNVQFDSSIFMAMLGFGGEQM